MVQIINKESNDRSKKPDVEYKVRELFDLDVAMTVPGFSKKDEYVPIIDDSYIFDKETTLSILAGFKYNRRVEFS